MNFSQINKDTITNITPFIMKEYYDLMQLIKQVLAFDSSVDLLLGNFFREHKNLTAIHKTIVAETVYGLLRTYYKLTNVVNQRNVHDLIGLVWVKILQLPESFYDNSKFKVKFNIDYTRFALINFLNEPFVDNMSGRTELPQFIIDQLLLQYSQAEMLAIADALQCRAPLDLRVNIIKTNTKAVFRQLQLEGLSPELAPFSPYAIRLVDKTHIARHKLFLNGSIEIQDESSQIAGMLLNPKRGDMIVDFCAGGGGKTLLLGMLMRNTGRIYAFDVNERRLNNLIPRLQRSGLSNVHIQRIAHENDTKVKRLYGKVDRVFIDAPCSGIGTLRRNPELKFRQTNENIVDLKAKQSSILSEAAKLLKINGYLVYATCSILYAENQAIIAEFLNTHPDFKLIEADTILHMPELKRDDGFVVLLPNLHNTDGFFAALLQKIS